MATTIVQRLRCKLTTREREQKTDELVRAMAELDEAKAEKAAAMKVFAARIGDAEKKVSDVAFDVRDCSEARPIECFERPNYALKMVDLVRGDLGEVISTRAMTEAERQTSNGLDGAPRSSNGSRGKDHNNDSNAAG